MTFVPINALLAIGDGMVQRSAQMPWYNGPALLEIIDQIDAQHEKPDDADQPFQVSQSQSSNRSLQDAFVGVMRNRQLSSTCTCPHTARALHSSEHASSIGSLMIISSAAGNGSMYVQLCSADNILLSGTRCHFANQGKTNSSSACLRKSFESSTLAIGMVQSEPLPSSTFSKRLP